MLRLKNFVDFPQLDAVVSELISCRSGLIVVSGMDPRTSVDIKLEDRVLPSGRNAIFGVLLQEILSNQTSLIGGVLVREESSFRSPRSLKHRIHIVQVEPERQYSEFISQVTDQGADLIAFDRLDAATISLAVQLIEQKKLVIVQLDSALWGEQIYRYISEIDPHFNLSEQISWIVSVQRIPTLCPHCKSEDTRAVEKLSRLKAVYPNLFQEGKVLAGDSEIRMYRTGSCIHCQGSGRKGDTLLVDVYRPQPGLSPGSVASLEECIVHQMVQGNLSIDDLVNLEKDLLRRTNQLLVSRERTLLETEANLHGRLAEIEASNRVLHRKTEELISLFDISQAMISSVDLDSLARRICQKASTLFAADRAVLYYLDRGKPRQFSAEILGSIGWESETLHQRVDLPEDFRRQRKLEPEAYKKAPPGVISKTEKGGSATIKSGLKIPLLAQDQLTGWMIIQSTQKKQFLPGESALLQTLASQAAMAIQRASLIDDLQHKIIQLEQAQVELVKKERVDRELELARQVQQSLLPQIFPESGQYRFAAINLPARQMGGDFYDVIQLDSDHLGIVIADVSDKGMPAAMYMALSRSLILAEAHRTISPRSTLQQVNHLLLELGDSAQFLAVFYGVIEQSTRKLTYTRAGHEHPLVLRQGKVIPLEGRGMILGMLEEEQINLSEEQFILEPGDRMILYTDGLTDAMNAKGKFYGLKNFEKNVTAAQSYPLLNAGKKIIAEISNFQGSAEQFDDMTILLVGVDD